MKTYHTADSDAGLSLPYFGRILGELAKAFRVPVERLTEAADLDAKQVQRFFAGQSIASDAVVPMLDAVAGLAAPPALAAVVAPDLQRAARAWNALAAEVNANTYPVERSSDLAWAPLRLVALELGLRLGAASAWRQLHDRAPLRHDRWLDPQPATWIVERLDLVGRSRDDLAKAAQVTRKTVDAWCRGESLPTKFDAIALIGQALSRPDDELPADLELRLLVGLRALYDRLAEVLDDGLLADLLAGVRRTTELACARVLFLRAALADGQPPQGMLDLEALLAWKRKNDLHIRELPNDTFAVMAHGLDNDLARHLCANLGAKAKWRQEVMADFAALAASSWHERVRAVYQTLGSLEHLPDALALVSDKVSGVDADTARIAAEATPEFVRSTYGLADFDWAPRDEDQVVMLEPPPFIQAMNRMVQAERAASVGDLPTAIAHAERAAELAPDQPAIHFKLGAWLGTLAQLGQCWNLGRRRLPPHELALAAIAAPNVAHLADLALAACRRAVELDRAFGNARNEFAIILSNVGRHAEAELAFAEAEPHHGHHAHHWLTRGGNLMALGRFAEAVTALTKAMELNRDGDHEDARTWLAATYMALGRGDRARSIGQPIAARHGWHPADHWQEIVELRRTDGPANGATRH